MLKDAYITPELEIVRFDVEDIITTSDPELPPISLSYDYDNE